MYDCTVIMGALFWVSGKFMGIKHDLQISPGNKVANEKAKGKRDEGYEVTNHRYNSSVCIKSAYTVWSRRLLIL